MVVQYQNGNYQVSIDLTTGTKTRETDDNYFQPNRVESMDVKITNQCSHGCAFCHENSVPDGNQASLEMIKVFALTLPPYTEIALGGGNLMEDKWHTEEALKIFKRQDAICSITVRQEDFVKDYGYISEWIKLGLVHGVGVSLSDANDTAFWALYNMTPTAVIHAIVGVVSPQELLELSKHKARVLFLGYKQIRRGKVYFDSNHEQWIKKKKFLADAINLLFYNFEICSFDNLALEQLCIKDKVTQEVWQKHYMGDDGTTSFYVDLVSRNFATSSTSMRRYPINGKGVPQMYSIIRESKC